MAGKGSVADRAATTARRILTRARPSGCALQDAASARAFKGVLRRRRIERSGRGGYKARMTEVL